MGNGNFDTSFDIFADNYDSARPGYPAALFEDIKSQCGIKGSSRLLEIGAGSGIATVELAKFGCPVVAIEPGSHLAAIAKERTKEFNTVEIFKGTFERFQAHGTFDVVLAFTAFHWLNKDSKYERTLDLLNDSGSLVLVWNSFFQSDSPVTIEVNSAYRESLADIYPEELTVAGINEGIRSKLNRREQEVITSPLFRVAFSKQYSIACNFDGQTYPRLLNTFPKIAAIEEARRFEFLSRISEIVERHGGISVPVLTTLIICQRRK